MKATIARDIAGKSNGITILKGEKVTVKFDAKTTVEGLSSNSRFSVTTDDGRRLISSRPDLVGIRTPGIRTLEKWSNDGIAKSVFGARVEPDGHDANGSPSWLLFMGLI